MKYGICRLDFYNIFRGAMPRESYLAEEFNMTRIISESSAVDEKENDSPRDGKSFVQKFLTMLVHLITHVTLVPRKQISTLDIGRTCLATPR